MKNQTNKIFIKLNRPKPYFTIKDHTYFDEEYFIDPNLIESINTRNNVSEIIVAGGDECIYHAIETPSQIIALIELEQRK